MSKKIRVRDVSPFLQKFRDFLLGRKHTMALRFQQDLATRSPDPPNLPEGPSHLLNTNYYYSRDGRREVCPPVVVVDAQLQLEDGSKDSSSCKKLAKPGRVHHWD